MIDQETIDLTTATDTLSCPACHAITQPEFRLQMTRGGPYPGGVEIRSRCPRCGRLWKGHLALVDEDRINA